MPSVPEESPTNPQIHPQAVDALPIVARPALRAEGMVWRYDVEGQGTGLTEAGALDALEAAGYGIVSARGLVKLAVQNAPRCLQ